MPSPLIESTASRPVPARVDRAGLANVIWNLHTILVAPDSTPQETREAKRRLLAVFEKSRDMRLPRTIIPPIAIGVDAGAKRSAAPHKEEADETCTVCSRPLPPTGPVLLPLVRSQKSPQPERAGKTMFASESQ